MKLTQDITILVLTRDYPFLVDALAERNEAYKKLKNPLLRQSMGRIATVGKAASMGNEDTLELMLFIAGRIMAATGEKVEIIPPAVQEGDKMAGILTDEQRLEALKEMILDLHEGADMPALQARFAQTVGDISPAEIAALEQTLVKEGLPESEIKRLCNLHVDLFRGSLDEQERISMPPGHPVNTYMKENERASELAEELLQELTRMGEEPDKNIWSFTRGNIKRLTAELADIRTHYTRKENQLFPLLEARGIDAPTKVMWEVHDDIRARYRRAGESLKGGDRAAARKDLLDFVEAVKDMIYKEEHILFPMAVQALSDEDWARAGLGEDEIGYAFAVEPGTEWQPVLQTPESRNISSGLVDLDTGRLPPEVINMMLRSLPVDMSFVDAEDRVAYYSDTPHRVFPRSPAVIGRNVQNCHPPKSVHMVTDILEKFKSGKRDRAEFWLETGGRFILIQYLALRDGEDKYLGCLEVAQDATHVRSLTGQRRLLEWD